MSLSLDRAESFTPRPGPLLIVIADGVGIAPAGPSNAVTEAHTPNMDRLAAGQLTVELAAHGKAVGLPSDDDMGNSEVGHNALGAGRIFAQGAKLVNKALADGSLFASPLWKQILDRTTADATITADDGSADEAGTLHFLGLHSDGNVHAHTDHLYSLLRDAAAAGVVRARVHILLDGRDTAARSALGYIEATEAVLDEINSEHGADYRIGSGGGRMAITMDRYDADWPMVERGYRCHTYGEGRPFQSAAEAVETMYGEGDTGDQYLDPFAIVDEGGKPVGTFADGDALVLFNFRGDRAIEISRAYEEADFSMFDRSPNGDGGATGAHPEVFFAGMLQYDGDLQIPKRYLVDPPAIDRTMGEYLCAAGVPNFAISETQKFGHVTFFWNGNRSGYLDESLETYIEIPSDNVEFNKAPAMKAAEITDATIELLRDGRYRFGRINFANGDMVGHTGDLTATIEAVESLDRSLGRLLEVIEEVQGTLIFTADHGNADIMYTEKNGERSPKTSHTLSPVLLAIHDPGYSDDYSMASLDDPGLSNVAATALNLLGFEAPDDYRPSLVTF